MQNLAQTVNSSRINIIPVKENLTNNENHTHITVTEGAALAFNKPTH